jgi:hypothetical protein
LCEIFIWDPTFIAMAMADSSFANDNIFFQGPSFHVDLAALDALHPVHYSPRLLIFRCASSAQRDAQLVALKISLQALVSRCPILGGIVVPIPSDVATDSQQDWRTIVPGQGIELVVRGLRTVIAPFDELEAAGFRTLQLPHDLLMPVPEKLGDRPFPSCKVQFSAIEGGTIITFTISHSLADGSGTNELMRILSEEAKLAQEPSSDGARSQVGDAFSSERRTSTSPSLPGHISRNHCPPSYICSQPRPAQSGCDNAWSTTDLHA